MKRKGANEEIKVNGVYSQELTRGFFGEQNEGKKMLLKMGLEGKDVPFSAAMFLRNKRTLWKDCDGNVVKISFIIKDNQIECFGSYCGKKKSIRLFREWSNCEDEDTIARLESEAIGDCCARCVYETM